ncbi:hypothetical protein [Pseudalkalibacillus sp. SCS-8]|uniref:hypothetical protein n=1 Tax=Pseudalkalibacillus nanhaiensis TaxID=3115291 RepID=UPI0032D9C8F6
MKTILVIFIYTILIAGGIGIYIIANNDIDHPAAFPFILGYVIFLLLTIFGAIIIMGFNFLRIGWREKFKRIKNFLLLYCGLVGLKLAIYYTFKPEWLTFTNIFLTSLGLALGWAFFDLLTLKKKKDWSNRWD